MDPTIDRNRHKRVPRSPESAKSATRRGKDSFTSALAHAVHFLIKIWSRFGVPLGPTFADFRALFRHFGGPVREVVSKEPPKTSSAPCCLHLGSNLVNSGPVLAHFRVDPGPISERLPATSVPHLSAHGVQIEARGREVIQCCL